jgi:AcrR family transcriptional regulator
LQSIAKAAGVTKSLLYYYFEDRLDLLATLYELVSTTLGAILGPLPEGASASEFWDWIEGVYRNVLAVVAPQPVLMAFVVRVLSEVNSGVTPPGFEKHVARTTNGVAALVDLGQRCSALRSDLPQPLLLSAVMALMGTCDRWIVAEAQEGRLSEATAATVVQLYKSAFASPGGARGRDGGSRKKGQ